MNNDKAKKMANRRAGLIVFIITICALISSIALGLGVRAYNRTSATSIENSSPPSSNHSVMLTTKPQTGLATEGEVVTVRPDGFDPKEIVRTQGPFFLVVENRSGVEDISLRISQEAGPMLLNGLVEKEKMGWLQEVNLAPGTYVLTEENHPEWVCYITVNP